MVDAIMRLVGFDLQRQIARLWAQAEEFKDRTTGDVKRQAVDVGVTVGLALFGLALVLLTLIAGLLALYLWVAMQEGPFVGLGVVALTTAALAAILFTVAATRGGKPKRPRVHVAPAVVTAEPVPAPPPHASLMDTVTHNLTHRTAAATNEALDSAAEIVRKGPREAVLATLAVAVVVGLFIGRRR